MSELKLAVFDVDGTLVDSRQMIFSAMERAWKSAGLGEIERHASLVGIPSAEIRRVILVLRAANPSPRVAVFGRFDLHHKPPRSSQRLPPESATAVA